MEELTKGGYEMQRKSAMVGPALFNTAQEMNRPQPQNPLVSMIKKMSPEQREEQYDMMGMPFNLKRKKLYFKSIHLFTSCVLKYFKPYLIFTHGEHYGGLKDSLHKF